MKNMMTPFKDRGLCLGIAALIVATSLTASFAGSVSIPHSFVAGQKASATQVNDDFAALATAVNDNDVRITRVESYVQARPSKRRQSFAAGSLSIGTVAQGQNVIAPQSNGLLWHADYSRDARLMLEKPLDYKAGTDVTCSIIFEVTSATAGTVEFFIRPQSFDMGDVEFDPMSISAAPLAVAGAVSYGGTIYRQDITIPASRFTKENWLVKIQRAGTPTETYGDPVLFVSATLEYEVQ